MTCIELHGNRKYGYKSAQWQPNLQISCWQINFENSRQNVSGLLNAFDKQDRNSSEDLTMLYICVVSARLMVDYAWIIIYVPSFEKRLSVPGWLNRVSKDIGTFQFFSCSKSQSSHQRQALISLKMKISYDSIIISEHFYTKI